MAECRQVVKKYYSCFPLLYYMAILMTNHHMLAATPEEGQAILEEAIHLCQRIQEEGQDVQLANEAVCLEATCRLMLGQPEKVLDILGEDFSPISQGKEILPQAYQMMGKTEKAKEVLQTMQYQHLLALVGGSINWMVLEADRPERADEILRRTVKLVELFEMDTLVPHIAMQVHYAAAQKYARSGDVETVLSLLELSVENLEYLSRSTYLHGNEYFDKLEEWFQTFDLGTNAPRSLKIIMESVEQMFLADPVLEPLRETPHFRQMMTRIKQSGKEG